MATFKEWWGGRVDDIEDAPRTEGANYNKTTHRWAWNAALSNQWQPIETAPKDGKPILAISKNAANRWTIPSVLVWNRGRGWEVVGFPEDRFVYHLPTHWMPLPDPPGDK